MIRRHHRKRAGLQPGPQTVLMHLVAERWRHHPLGGMVPVGMGIFAVVQGQVLDQRLAPDALALLARAPDRLMRLFAGGVHDIKRHAGHIGNHDRPVRRLALHRRGPGIGMRLWPRVAFGHQPGLQLGHHIAVLGMNHRQPAQVAHAAEAGEQLVIVHHQGALVGHEVLERGDASLDRRLHVVPHLLPPPGDRHVVGIVARGAARFVVPHPCRIHQPLALPRQDEVHHHRGAPRQRRPRAGFKIIRRIGAHEGHLQMRMRVNPAGHDEAAGRIQHLVAFQVRSYGGDDASVDQDVGLVGQVGGDDGAVLDDGCHCSSPRILSARAIIAAKTAVATATLIRRSKKGVGSCITYWPIPKTKAKITALTI